VIGVGGQDGITVLDLGDLASINMSKIEKDVIPSQARLKETEHPPDTKTLTEVTF